ncbi:uncharacterized protein PHACADRAFT_179990 [Phanerochaete carnosa HHB-10118-sp]|uniref:Uncharacterized protein n=1 Tax=Phanerochaete carnosa (strain HHB-10118-sp) TaxID=650164 RepID=K5WA78_PHACS|nr:uncharacterized protein PHACADRAFT_179990 [Phanerochaete carnosa HHB-10118-sp]EKM60813.1 hypothetical protein PHACADRAFT_179990 [Phanerochaete carnosa HHB-10118-sp]
MDELLHHCIRELAFEGDLGCDASRLRGFISEFYRQKSSTQNVDDDYCAFVWSVVAQQPEVRVGIVPEGASEVYIAPQSSKKAKGKAKDGEGGGSATQETFLHLIPDAAEKSLDELMAEHGNALRIAVDPDKSFIALTGSHIRPSKLTPMVYSCLQLVARGRENGMSVVDLSRKTGYDAKTSHYLVEKLLGLDLVVKLKKAGVGSNLCVHKYFFEKSETWQNIRAVEQAAKEAADEKEQPGDEDDDVSEQGSIQFDPIGVKHLSRLDILKGRLEKLLKNSPHNLYQLQNLVVAIGFSNPTKSERRFFQTRLRELETEGFLEIVQARGPKRLTKCVRLIDREESDETSKTAGEPIEPEGVHKKVMKTTVTFQRQILDIIDGAGNEGATLNSVVEALCNFDKRVMDFQLNRLNDLHPPPHLRDLGLSQLAENYGRERRYKYFTLVHYVKVAAKEKLQVPFPEDYLSQAGGYCVVDEHMFYEDMQELHSYIDSLKTAEEKPKKKLGRPRKHPLPEGAENSQFEWQKKRKRDQTEADDISSAPPKKRGRPRKHPLPEGLEAGSSICVLPTSKRRGRSGKKLLPEEEISSAPVPEKRGRPPKHPRPEDDSASAPAPKRRGRPPKHAHPEDTAEAPNVDANDPTAGESGQKDRTALTVPAQSGSGPVASGEQDQSAENLRPVPEGTVALLGNAQKATTSDASPAQPESASVPDNARKKGRPRKHPLPREASAGPSTAVADAPRVVTECADQAIPSAPPTPKKRGRPPKIRFAGEASTGSERRDRLPKNLPSKAVSPPAEMEQAETVEWPEQPPVVAPEEPPQTVSETDARQPDAPLTTMERAQDLSSAAARIAAAMNIDAAAIHGTEELSVNHLGTSLTPPNNSVIDPALLEMDRSAALGPQIITVDTSVSAQPPATLKRTLPDSADRPSTKRQRHTGPLTNISRGRRQKEILQALEGLGGIVNTSVKEFYSAHAAVVESLANAGEATSTAVGSHLDKKTLNAVLLELESQEKIKMITTSITPPTGGPRQIKIAYLANTPDEKLNEFLASLSRTQRQPTTYQPTVKILDEPVDFGGNKTKKASQLGASIILLNEGDSGHDNERVKQLLQADEEAIRASLLTEPNTTAQKYGLIFGKIARARELYLHLVRVIEECKSSSVISTEPRIMHVAYVFQDIPVSVYTSIVAIRIYNEELLHVLSTPADRQTAIKDLPKSMVEACEIDKWKTRSSMMDTLHILQGLRLMIALNPTDAEEPAVKCLPNGEHPTAFGPAPDEKHTATLSAPQYWKLNDSVPLHLWALSNKEKPYLWKRASTKTFAEGEQFWKDLHRSCLDEAFSKSTLDDLAAAGSLSEKASGDFPDEVAKLLCRSGQWSTTYNFSWYQRQYLRKQIDIIPASTPLQDEDGGEARLSKLAMLVSAPKEQVAQFYERERHSLLEYVENMRKRKEGTGKRKEGAGKRKEAQTEAQKVAQKAVLAQKAAEARAELEKAWEDMLARVHSEPLKGTFASRMKPVRTKFLQSSGRDVEKWEQEIAKTIQEAKVSAKKPVANRRPLASTSSRTMLTPPPLAIAPNEKPVEELISSQGPPLDHVQVKGKKDKDKKEKGKSKDCEPRIFRTTILTVECATAETDMFGRRRQRFQWNKDLDELGRDASAIIRARCRNGKRLDWAALCQVFPAIPRNSVRQRIGHLREQPGAETYFKRLEDRWYELWMRHLGTPELPDEDPGSPSNFDLVAHIKFLRSHIDKNALRVGFVETEKPLAAVLPASLDIFSTKWEVVEKPTTSASWDFMWSGVAEEGREKQLMQQSFVLGGNELPQSDEYPSENMFVADTALKMTLGTPNDTYDAQKASHLLSLAGDEAVGAVVEDLLEHGVLSKLVRDPTKHKPGRTLKISDGNLGALNGQLAPELYQDATTLEEMLSQQDPEVLWRDWPLVAGDGDVAALIELASNNKLEFSVDISRAQSARPTIDWNSKKASDDDIETAISVRIKEPIGAARVSPPEEDAITHETEATPPSMHSESEGHGTTADGERACCAIWSTGLANCVACLSVVTQTLLDGSGLQDAQRLRSLLDVLEIAGSEGLTKDNLEKLMDQDDRTMLSAHIGRLTGSVVPLAFWSGYREVVLVSSRYWNAWSVVTSEEETKCARVLPRRWLDISGHVISEVWNAARKAIMAIVIFHPGISQAEIRWRLRSVYDRQEVNDTLQQLMEEGFTRRDARTSSILADEGMPSNMEEKSIFWSTSGQKIWYQV